MLEAEEQNFIVGEVMAVFFQNPSNFYKVMLIHISETNITFSEKEIVVTGSFGEIQEEESYRFFGHLVDHPRYGRQFQAASYQQERPISANGVVNYLSSSKFPGIGKKTAEKIVEELGEDAIDKILNAPGLLKGIPSLNDKKRHLLLENLRANLGMDQVIIGLNRYGFGSQLSFAIYQTYQNEALEIIEENPYQLVEDIDGIGFKKADNLAEQLGIEANSPKRIRAAILHQIFQQAVQTGDTYSDANNLLVQCIDLLESSRPVEIPRESVAECIFQLAEEGKIQQEEAKLYDNSLYFSEWGIGSSVNRLLSRKKEIKYSKKAIDKHLALIEKRFGITYGTSQEKSIREAVKSPLFILTGGPGTGKTTVINGIVQLFAELNELELEPSKYTDEVFPIKLAAPTGRAAKRMNETTGLQASTIHRMLGLNGREKPSTLAAKELDGGLLIVDEMSMVDTWLANTLFKAIPSNMQVILVGDKDQLPSVGPGQVFHDLLQTEEIPKMELTEIYRQGMDSSIIPLAHEIKEGRLPADFAVNQPDRSFFSCHAQQIEPLIHQIVEKAVKKGFTPQDIQVLAPMYRGSAGIDALNKMLQEVFNGNDGSRKEVIWNETIYRIGDKVLQLVNEPELNVFNGDMGIITGIGYGKDTEDKVDELTIRFDSNEVTYKRNEWNKITLSYCCSIHKAQGSEFKMVILPMVHQYSRMLQRNLLYTAVTRSRELLILLGEASAFANCVTHQSVSRLTTLKERITQAEEMSLATRKQLENYETSVREDDPFRTESKEEKTPARSVSYEKAEETGSSVKEAVSEDAEDYKYVDLFEQEKEKPVVKSFVLTLQDIQTHAIDPMIGMENVSPEQFMI